MTILVTGGAGFIGHHLVARLISLGHTVRVLDNLSTGKHLIRQAETMVGDIRDKETVAKAVSGVEAVVHLAALPRIRPSIDTPLETFNNNLSGHMTVLEAARNAGVAHFVFASSSSIYGDQSLPFVEDAQLLPKTPYSLFKAQGEALGALYSDLYGMTATSLRLFNVYGEGMPEEGSYSIVVGKFLKQRREGEPFTVIGTGNQRRDFTYVADVVEAFVKVLDRRTSGIFNIGTGHSVSILDLAAAIDHFHPIVYLPRVEQEAQETLCDNSKAKMELQWAPKTTILNWLETYASTNLATGA